MIYDASAAGVHCWLIYYALAVRDQLFLLSSTAHVLLKVNIFLMCN